MFKPPHWDWTKPGEVGWWVRPGRRWLIGPEGLAVDEWQAQGHVETVKTEPQHMVYRVTLPQGIVYIKRYLIRLPGRGGRWPVCGAKVAEEVDDGRPTITRIALGEQRKHSFLLRIIS